MRRKATILILMVVLIVFVAIQFMGSTRRTPAVDPAGAVEAVLSPPAEVTSLMRRSCADCHSYGTEWPWYAQVAPVSWWIDGHVEEAREHMNLSAWASYTPDEMDDKLEEMCEEVEERAMPLPSYTCLHRDAPLTDTEIDTLCTWTEAVRRELHATTGTVPESPRPPARAPAGSPGR